MGESSRHGDAVGDLPERRLPGQAPRYVPALDGLRALSVAAVLLYHAEVADVGGGFLGVEVFFVLSGYLITSVLLAEGECGGGVALASFWVRRARRLLPALAFACAGAVVAGAVFAPDTVERTELDAVATLLFIVNWVFVARTESYLFALDRVPLLRHLWSLSVEEQFYAVWPLAFLAARRLASRRWLAAAAVAAAVGSALWLAHLYDPATDPSSLYFRTDTRLSGLLFGAAFALGLPLTSSAARRPGTSRAVARNLLGLMGLGVLGWAFATARDAGPFVYRGGFVAVDMATLAVITAAVIEGGFLARALGCRAVTAVGRRSYAIYLWHGPVFALTRPGLDNGLDVPSALALRLALTGLAAEISYRWVERGAPRGDGGREAARQKPKGAPRRRLALPLALSLSASMAVCGVASLHRPAGANSKVAAGLLPPAAPLPVLPPSEAENAEGLPVPFLADAPLDLSRPAFAAVAWAPRLDDLRTVERGTSGILAPPRLLPPWGAAPAEVDDVEPAMVAFGRRRRPTLEGAPPPPHPPAPVEIQGAKTLTVLTDSVTLGARASLPHALPDWTVEFVGRPALMIKQVLPEFLRDRKTLGSVVVIGVGYNSLFEKERRHFERWAAQWDREAEALLGQVKARGAKKIVWVTLREPTLEVVGESGKTQYERYAWYFPYVNERIRALVLRHPEVQIADWGALSSNVTGLTCDLIHLNTPGARLMAHTIVEAVLGGGAQAKDSAASEPNAAP